MSTFSKRDLWRAKMFQELFDNEVNEKIRNPQKEARNTNIFILNRNTRSGQSVLGPDDTIRNIYPQQKCTRPKPK